MDLQITRELVWLIDGMRQSLRLKESDAFKHRMATLAGEESGIDSISRESSAMRTNKCIDGLKKRDRRQTRMVDELPGFSGSLSRTLIRGEHGLEDPLCSTHDISIRRESKRCPVRNEEDGWQKHMMLSTWMTSLDVEPNLVTERHYVKQRYIQVHGRNEWRREGRRRTELP